MAVIYINKLQLLFSDCNLDGEPHIYCKDPSICKYYTL
jgi:hypothetical protein